MIAMCDLSIDAVTKFLSFTKYISQKQSILALFFVSNFRFRFLIIKKKEIVRERDRKRRR